MGERINSWGQPVPSAQVETVKATERRDCARADVRRLAEGLAKVKKPTPAPIEKQPPKAVPAPVPVPGRLVLEGDDLVVLADLLDTHPALRKGTQR